MGTGAVAVVEVGEDGQAGDGGGDDVPVAAEGGQGDEGGGDN